MAVHIDDSSRDEGWSITRSSGAGASARVTRGAAVELPEMLRDTTKFQPTDQFVAEARIAPRVTRGLAAPLRVHVDVADTAPRIAVARHESGAVTFHLPDQQSGPARRGAARASSRRATFTIPVRPSASASGPARRGLLSRIVKVVVVRVINAVARPVLRLLARKLEEKLWNRAKRSEGWVRITDAGLAAGLLEHAAPNPSENQPALLLLHGTFSNTLAAFTDLLKSSAMHALRARYGPHIYGFDHFTISKSPADNVDQLLEELKGTRATFDCISHSRGGLVLRTLARSGGASIGRAIQVAAPNRGTPLATPQRWEDTLGWFANLMEMFPENPFTTVSGWIAEGLSWVAQHVTGDLPGLESMDGNGQVIRDLAGTPSAASVSSWYTVASNYTPANGQWAQRLLDMGIEEFFQGTNDLVVPTAGCWQFDGAGGLSVSPSQVGCYGSEGNVLASSGNAVHHLNLFAQQETRDLIVNALAGTALDLPPIASPGPRRRAVEAAAPVAARVEVAAPAQALNVVIAPVPQEMDGLGWYDEDAFNLIVLPLPRSQQTDSHQSAQLLATYGSARVLAPFRLGGEAEGAGSRWHNIIAFQKTLNSYAEGTTDELTPERIRDGGIAMFNTLFQNDVRRLYDQARFQHEHRKLNVVFTSMIPWVADLPWELAYDPSCKSFLALSDVRFVRNVLTPVPADRIPSKSEPLRILVVSSVPQNQQPLSEDDERAAILRSFSELIQRRQAVVEPLVRATPIKLQEKVRREKVAYDVVHFIGHGEFDDATQTGYLIFEDDRGGTNRISTDAARNILRTRGIRLLFLNACVSARGSSADYNKGVAPGLVADGVPAVVANQYSVLDCSATMFANHFYRCLVQGLTLGDAMRESRIALSYLVDTGVDWAVPVLFARNPNARLRKPDAEGGGEPAPRDVAAPAALPAITGRAEPARALRPAASSTRSLKHKRVAVWDVADSLPNLETYLAQMNQAQSAFVFEPVALTAPLGTWELRPADTGGSRVPYITAERIAQKMKNIISSLGVDLLLCVTNLPMRDKTTLNLYLWCDSGDDPQRAKRRPRIAIFSTWGFDPPVTGERLARALANIAVQALASCAQDNAPEGPKGSIAYYNQERDVECVVGPLAIDRKTRSILAKSLSAEELESMEALLALHHPQSRGASSTPRKSKTSKRKGRRKKNR